MQKPSTSKEPQAKRGRGRPTIGESPMPLAQRQAREREKIRRAQLVITAILRYAKAKRDDAETMAETVALLAEWSICPPETKWPLRCEATITWHLQWWLGNNNSVLESIAPLTRFPARSIDEMEERLRAKRVSEAKKSLESVPQRQPPYCPECGEMLADLPGCNCGWRMEVPDYFESGEDEDQHFPPRRRPRKPGKAEEP